MISIGYIQSFRRYETKYLLTDEQRQQFITLAGETLERDKYGEYTICNLYLDTDDFYLIEHSLDKPVYKEKLRIRSYGNVSGETDVFFEIKKKYRGIVYKRRITIPYIQAMDYLENGAVPPCLQGYHARQIFNEIDFLMKKYRPSAKVYLAYDREAYSERSFPDLRITFDRNIRSRWDDLTLSSDEGTKTLAMKGDWLMEIKSSGAMPIRYCRILTELGIRPVSFSKYGNIYKAERLLKQEVTNEA